MRGATHGIALVRRRRASCATLEPLEPRRFLSAVLEAHPSTTAGVNSSSLATTYAPDQIQAVYGLTELTVANPPTRADGAGQTIAIVEAFDSPSVTGDLQHFDRQFGLADPPSLMRVNQAGGSRLPATNVDWAAETALDVQWAHAIAPAANLVLVEANSNRLDDLLAAVDTARHRPGVSVVSMSWGTPEFTSESSFDDLFTTPAGHAGVTFVASAGDRGASSGPQWPASSPDVLSVGGTTLNLNADGSYGSETPWSGSLGGVSAFEAEPVFQVGVQTTGSRTTPDVSYDADPSTGFAVYNSAAGGWQTIGGTSAGAPQWAALIAIANQQRAAAGQDPLDGSGGTLPALYSAGGGAFHTVPSDSVVVFTLTNGLGSPKAAALVPVLAQARQASVPAAPPTPGAARPKLPNRKVRPDAEPLAWGAVKAVPVPPPMPATNAVQVARTVPLPQAVGPKAPSAVPPMPGAPMQSSRAIFVAANAAAMLGEASIPGLLWEMVRGVVHVPAVLASYAPAAVAPAALKAAEAVLPMAEDAVYAVASVNATAVFADSIGTFINECAGILPAAGDAPALPSRSRAWAITAAVLAADVLLVRYGLRGRSRQAGKKKSASVAPFPAAPDVYPHPVFAG